MTGFSRRAFIAGGVALTATSAGCVSNGGEETAEPTESGEGNETTTEA